MMKLVYLDETTKNEYYLTKYSQDIRHIEVLIVGKDGCIATYKITLEDDFIYDFKALQEFTYNHMAIYEEGLKEALKTIKRIEVAL